MNIDNDTIRTWLQVLAVEVMPIASIIYTWIATRDKDNSQHIKAVETALGQQIATHAARIDRIEGELKHLPSKDDISGLRSDLRGLQVELEATQREIQAIRSVSNRIETYLLNK